jgi:hypothetical protein
MKTSELTRHALNWAVAKCEGVGVWYDDLPQVLRKTQGNEGEYAPSDDWAQGGLIIEREKIGIQRCIRACEYHGWLALKDYSFEASVPEETTWGDTPLEAAMRCYVASKLGDEVEIPTELTQGETK